MITGGLGGLGLLFAEWASMQGASHVSLLDVVAAPLPARITHTRGLDESSDESMPACAISAILADSGSAECMAAAADACMRRWAVSGVMHAAGMLRDATISNQTPASFRAVLGCKVVGLDTLHGAMQATPLMSTVLFSSVSSIVAPLGQPNYAAANAMLNTWASAHCNQVSLISTAHRCSCGSCHIQRQPCQQ